MKDSEKKFQKREKFRSLAESRTNKAIEAISRIGNLSNRSSYEWDEAEIKKIIKAIRDVTSEVEGKFSSPRGKNSKRFKL